MTSGGFPYNQWSARPNSDNRRFLPLSGTFSSDPANAAGLSAQDNRQPHSETDPVQQYVSLQQLFQQPPVSFESTELQRTALPFPTSGASYQEPLSSTFVTSGPVVHEGFIPAPGHEDYDDVWPSYPGGRPDDPFYNHHLQSSSEEDSEAERFLVEAVDNDNLEKDKDYSASEDELENDPDEMLIDEEFDDEEDEPAPRRGKHKGRSTRGSRRGRPSSRGRGGARNTVSLRERNEGASGRPKGKRGPRPTADPGPQFKEFQRLANEAYMKGNFPQAMHYALEAVKLNPEIFAAHNTLSEIYASMGDELASIKALIVGGPTKRDKRLWWLIIERVENIDPDQYPHFTEEARMDIYRNCLKSLLMLDPNDYEARSKKLEVEAQLGNVSACVKLCRKMLKIRPHDYDTLKQMAILGTSSTKQTKIHLSKIIQSYDFSISHWIANDDPSNTDLDWSLLNIYLDLLDRAGDYNYALSRLKYICRWKQGRGNESFWDDQEDDREFDLEDAPRRIAVPEFSRDSQGLKYGKTLLLEIRVKMGLFRLLQDPPKFSEAMHHLENLKPEDESNDAYLWEYPDLFCLAADTLHGTGHDRDALRFYEPLIKNMKEQLSLKSFMGLYTCYKNLDEPDNAAELIPIMQEWEAATLDDLVKLAKFFEDIGMHDEAWQRAEIAFRNKGQPRLRNIGFRAYPELRDYFIKLAKQRQGKHGVRKARAKKYIKKLKIATNTEQDSEDDTAVGERPSLGPLGERPTRGLFRTKERVLATRPQTFLPVDSDTLEGTNVPINAIDHRLFRAKLENLAITSSEELKAARAQHREIVASFGRLDELSDAADQGDLTSMAESISIARELIEEFSTFDLFYSDRRQDFGGYFRRIGSGEIWKDSALMALAVEANRIEDGDKERELKEKTDEVPNEFYGVHFDRWVDVFGRYALLLARQGESERSFSALDVALQSNIFYKSPVYFRQLEICRLACALAVGDSLEASSAIRWLLKAHPFGTDLFRLYNAANRLCPIADGFQTGPSLKAFLRYIKTVDYALLNPEQRSWYNFRGDDRTQWMQNAVTSNMIDQVKDHDPALFALYGHLLCSGGSYIGALNYYFRAYAITPQDPVLNLSIGLAYLQHAMKRLSENRQFQIQQGLSFINRYYELRIKDGVALHCSEAEFNVARVWHGLGLYSQALKAYDRCISLSRQVKEEASNKCSDSDWGVEDFVTEAAFAKQTIYMLTGDFEDAQMVTQEALIIE